MTWLRLDDQFADQPEVAPLSDAAFRLLVTSMIEGCRQLTDGFVAEKLAPTFRRAPTGKAFARAAQELEESGAWLRVDGGWQIAPELWRNPTAAEVEAKRAARARAGAAGGRASGATRRSNGEAIASSLLEQTPSTDESETNPVPVPVPNKHPTGVTRAPRAPKPKLARLRSFPDFEPNDADRETAKREGIEGEDFERELAKFRDHEFSAPKSDPHKTFRNWLRNSRSPFGRANAAPAPRGPVAVRPPIFVDDTPIDACDPPAFVRELRL